MMKRLLLFPIIILLALSISCSDNDSPTQPRDIVGSGTPTTVTRTLTPFQSVSLRIPGDVVLTYGTAQNVSVTVDDNVIQYVETEDSSGTLIIRFDASVSVSQYDLTVNLTMTALESIICESPGTITGTNKFDVDAVSLVLSSPGSIDLELDVNQLASVISGVGNINLIGTADVHSIVISGVGNMKAFGLVTEISNVVISGLGNAELTVSTLLDVVISGGGSVLYKGHPPTINVVVTGTGSVIDSN